MSADFVENMAGGALFLDCDGTIAPEVERAHAKCVRNMIKTASEQAEIPFAKAYYNAVWMNQLGKGILNFVNKYIDGLSAEDKSALLKVIGSAEKLEKGYEDAYVEFSKNPENAKYFVVRRGLSELFNNAAEHNFPVIAVSNAHQKVLEATLGACFGANKLKDIFTLIIGKDTIEAAGFKAKPDRGAIDCARTKVEEIIERKISLRNSIGFGDTTADYSAFSSAGIKRMILCDNSVGNVVYRPKPDNGIIVITKRNDVNAALNVFWSDPNNYHQPDNKPKFIPA